MKSTIIKLAALTMLMTASSWSQAQNQQMKTAEVNPKAIRESLVRWTEQDLKGLYLSCANASSNRLLDLDEATVCSSGSEELKNRVFHGNFKKTLAWWSSHKNDEAKELNEYLNP